MESEEYMMRAIELAHEAMDEGEVPVGCVVVKNGEIVGRGRNRREKGKNALLHAEIEAINEACTKLRGWRLIGCSLYVTLEPCPMCAGAIINSRIERVYFGARDAKAGACGGVINLFEENFNHKPALYGGLLGRECEEILKTFFRKLR